MIYIPILARKKILGSGINQFDFKSFGLDELEKSTKEQIETKSKNSALSSKLRDIYKILVNKILNNKIVNSAQKIYNIYFKEGEELNFKEMENIINNFFVLIKCKIKSNSRTIYKTFKKLKKITEIKLNSIFECKFLLKESENIIKEEYNNKLNDYKNKVDEKEYYNMVEKVIDNLICDNKEQIIDNLFLQYVVYYCSLMVLKFFNEKIKENEERDIKELTELFLAKK